MERAKVLVDGVSPVLQHGHNDSDRQVSKQNLSEVSRRSLEHVSCLLVQRLYNVQFCWLTAHLYEGQISKGVIVVAHACCEPVLQSSCEQ